MKRIETYVLIMLALRNDGTICQEKGGVDYPFLTQIVVNCRVEQIGKNKMLFYYYTLENSPSNHGNVSDFLIDISRAEQFDSM